MRLGPGPVFAYEWLTTTRRWQLYAIRTLFVAAILIGMMLVWGNSAPLNNPRQTVSIQKLATYAQNLYEMIGSIELTLVLLAAPAATAGAICLDKARGTLDHMLATDLSNTEIILGKIGVRLVPVLGLIACVLPITALASLLGGIDPTAVLGSFLTAIACAAVGCSLALTLSVWGRKTHEVLMMTYLLLIFWLITPVLVQVSAELLGTPIAPNSTSPAWRVIACSNPYYLVFAPYSDPGKVGVTTYSLFLGLCLVVAALLLGLATRRIRTVALKQAGQPVAGTRPRRNFRYFPTFSRWPSLPGPSLDGNPILWREWHRSRPSRFLRVVWMLYTALGLFWIVVSFNVVTSSPRNQEGIAIMCTCQTALGLLLLSVSAATSLADERARGSLDILLSTPLSTRSILAGKWWGSFRQATPVLIWPAFLAGIHLAQSGRWISYLLLLGLVASYCAVITSLGLAMATWVSRIGRAVAMCVSTYVVSSVGWLIFVSLLGPNPGPGRNNFMLAVMMGSPLYGTLFATIAVAPEALRVPGGTTEVVLGAFFWMVVSGIIAFVLFLTTLATFDDCLGRVSESAGRPLPVGKPPGSREVELELDGWFGERPAAVSGPIHH